MRLRVTLAALTATLLPLAFTQANVALDFPNQQFSCNNELHYKIYFAGINTGWLDRTEIWHAEGAKFSSSGYAGILGIGTSFKQESELSWNTEEGFITQQFTQQVKGFKNRVMEVETSDLGRKSIMLINQQKMEFANEGRAILDADTISAQIRFKLLQGERNFMLTRQASDMLEHYQYTVSEPFKKEIEPWGLLPLISVKQDGADEVTMWFSPKLNYQLVKAKYHSVLLPGHMQLTQYARDCPKH